jgi:DNA helicase IV
MEARSSVNVLATDWDSLREVGLEEGVYRVEVRVYNSGVEDFDLHKGQLKANWFRYRGGTAKYWWRILEGGQV